MQNCMCARDSLLTWLSTCKYASVCLVPAGTVWLYVTGTAWLHQDFVTVLLIRLCKAAAMHAYFEGDDGSFVHFCTSHDDGTLADQG